MKFIGLLLCLWSFQGAALVIPIHDERDISQNINIVHKALVDYENYKNLDDEIRYNLVLDPLKKFQVKIRGIDMFKSQSEFEYKDRGTKAIVLVTLQPMNLTNAEVYPTFIMSCKSQWLSETSFKHNCDLLSEYPHFGIDQFSSSLEVTQEKEGSSHLKYDLTLKSNADDIEAIINEASKSLHKKYVWMPLSVVRSAVNILFDVENFFRSYYAEFYERWVANITTYEN